jgi:hypothetical protein
MASLAATQKRQTSEQASFHRLQSEMSAEYQASQLTQGFDISQNDWKLAQQCESWARHLKIHFDAEQAKTVRTWIENVPEPDLKDPLLFLLACDVKLNPSPFMGKNQAKSIPDRDRTVQPYEVKKYSLLIDKLSSEI